MTTQNLEYYRLRADEELAAAERAADPAIAQIHCDMAQRYRAKLHAEPDTMNGDAGLTEAPGGAFAEPQPVFG